MNTCPVRDPARFMGRRDFLAMAATSSAAALAGCVTNPVTGKSQFSLVSEDQEIAMDRENAPHQVSADYGAVRSDAVNRYVGSVGTALTGVSHRPSMPYSFRAVNASYINAYAFPGGSIAATRGILLELGDEAQLAGLLGHEVGHVCARHTASRMTTGMLAQLVVAGAAIALEQSDKGEAAAVVAGLGGVGAGMLLARYSRADERQADALGMEYMTKAGYNPQGMAGLMEVLLRQERNKPGALEMMFATHPMSQERHATALAAVRSTHAAGAGLPVHRERYMDSTAPVRALADTIQAVQRGDTAMAAKKPKEAEGHYAAALRKTPDDYEALLKMSGCLLKQNRAAEAQAFASRAKQANPGEPQALHAEGFAALSAGRADAAHQSFAEYAKRLPGNPTTLFLDGLALEAMGRKRQAAERYAAYLQAVGEGREAEHAAQRLTEWGFAKP
ncbi:MAG: tetratricopeptide repeat protein [Lentisphaerae bacterium]|nr:tetratricopeptide repeat protein [Lentisphaerota bacterium]